MHSLWHLHMLERANRRQKTLLWIFCINARFNRVTMNDKLLLRQRQRFAECHAQLPFDQISASNHFRYWMLDLQARIHFHEIETAVLIGNELHRTGTDITDRLRSSDSGFTHRATALCRHAGCWRFFEYFLMAALHRAIALEQIHALPMTVGEDLNFNVAWPAQILFDQHAVVAKTADRFTLA